MHRLSTARVKPTASRVRLIAPVRGERLAGTDLKTGKGCEGPHLREACLSDRLQLRVERIAVPCGSTDHSVEGGCGEGTSFEGEDPIARVVGRHLAHRRLRSHADGPSGSRCMACKWGRPWVLCSCMVHAMGARPRGGRRRTCWVVMRVGGFMGHFIGMVEAYAGCFEGSMGFLTPPERALSRSRLFFISTARRTDISFAAFIFASSFSCTAETIGAVDGRPS